MASLDIGIHDEKTIDIMEGAHELLQCFVNSLHLEGALCPWRTGGEHIPPHSVCALLIQNRPRIDGVAAAFAHLLSIGCHDELKAEAVFIGRLVVKERACRQKAIEPAARLIDGFGDKISGIRGWKRSRICRICRICRIVKRVVPLGGVGASGIKPAINDIRHAMHRAAAFIAGEKDIIYIRPVEFDIVGDVRAARFQLGDTADAVLIATRVACPDRQRRSPITFAA